VQLPEPSAKHLWLQQLVGQWTFEVEYSMGPDQPLMKSAGTESVRLLGQLWTIGEGLGEMPDGGESRSIMTLGFDPKTNRFVGTFIASTMTHLWIYDGALDAAGKILTLDAEGPSFAADGKLAKYQDIIEFIDTDLRKLSSRIQGEDGQWFHFMTAYYRRVKS
jgi:hypothetical protein